MIRLATILLFIASLAPAHAQTGLGLMQPGNGGQLSDAQLKSPNVKHVTLRERWAALEPTRGKFDDTHLIAQVRRCRKANKPFILGVMSGGHADNPCTPLWIAGTRWHGVLLPWTAPTLMDEYRKLQEHLAGLVVDGVKLGDDPLCVEVWITGPTFGSSQETHTKDSSSPDMTGAPGYSAAKMTALWRQAVDIIATTWPHKAAVLSLSGQTSALPYLIPTIDYCKAQLGNRAQFQFNSLGTNTQANYWPVVKLGVLQREGYRVGAEMVQPGQVSAVGRFPWLQWVCAYPGDVR